MEASGTAAAITDVIAEAGLKPTILVASTLKAYVKPFVRPMAVYCRFVNPATSYTQVPVD